MADDSVASREAVTRKAEPDSKPALVAVYLTALAAIIAAAMPFTAYINGRYSVQVEREKFIAQMRLNYLDRALDTSRDVFYRESVLRFLLDTTEPSDPIYKWAASQLKNADEIRRLQAEILKADAGIESIRIDLAKERSQRTLDKSAASLRERELLRRIAVALEDRTRLEEALSTAEVKAGRLPETQAVGRTSRLETEGAAKSPGTPKPKISSAVAEVTRPFGGSARLIISGSNFGSEEGHVYIVHNYSGGSQSFERLNVLSWNDIFIEAEASIPVDPRRQLSGDGPEIYIGLTTADSRFSEHVPVSVQLGGSF